MTSAVVGNGSLLATISARGRVERLWWPHPDRAQHLGELRLGFRAAAADDTRWLDEEPFTWTQEYRGDTGIVRTTARDAELTIQIEDVVLADAPVLCRRVSCEPPGGQLVVQCRPELDERTRALGARVDAPSGALAFYRSPYALALAAAPDVASGCGGLGRVSGRVYSGLDAAATVACAFAASPGAAVELATAALETPFDAHANARSRADAARLARAQPPERGELEPLYRRSLLVFDALADRETGAVIAAPECDADFVHSGGYGFVWPRDLAFLVLAFLAARRDDLAEAALRWLPSAQEGSGLWLQRHWTDATLAPSWCDHQLDETGAVLFAYEAAWRELRNEELDEALWPSGRAAADYLVSALDEDGLPPATADLWEEQEGCHAYTAAALAAGLAAAAALAERHEPAAADGYAAAAERLRDTLDCRFWSDEHGRYLRAVGDATVDVSLLGLAWPFRAVDPASPRMRATADAVARTLGRPNGGVCRYAGDTYAGGNAWVLAALWLGLYRRQLGDAGGHAAALEYAQRVATPLGLLPEQVTDDGAPAWVVPLAWSHAMFVLAARPELSVVAARAARPAARARVPR